MPLVEDGYLVVKSVLKNNMLPSIEQLHQSYIQSHTTVTKVVADILATIQY